MTTKTVQGFIYAHKYDWETEFSYKFLSFDDFSDIGYILVCPHDLTFTIPDGWNPVPGQIAAMEAEKAKLQKEFMEKVRILNERISKLQAIEFNPSEVAA